MRDKDFIKSFGKGFAILELMGKSEKPLSLTEIANHLGYNKTATQRFLYSLVNLGYAKKTEGKRYSLGYKVLSLGVNFQRSDKLYTLAQPYLEDLSNQLQRSLTLGVLDDTEVLIIYRKELKRFFPYAIYAGSKMPAHCSSTGKVLLAGLPDSELERLLDRMPLPALTPKTKTRKGDLVKEVQKTRQRGYAVSDQEFSLDLYAIGFPILDQESRVAAALTVSINVAEKKNKILLESVRNSLIETCRFISKGLGYEGPYPAFYWQ
jgi:IclR family pca regulon transcriptional regulator